MDEVKKVLMTKKLARAWLKKIASKPEYRFEVLWGPSGIGKLAQILRHQRDGKLKIASLDAITDLGIKEYPDKIAVWSSDREKLAALNNWLSSRGFETSGCW